MTVLRQTLSFEFPDFGLKYLVTVIPKGQPPKFRTSAWNFFNSETGSKYDLLLTHADSNWLIIIDLKKKAEYGHVLFGPVTVSIAWDRVRYSKFLIITRMTSTLNFYFFKKTSFICIFYQICSRCIIDINFFFVFNK